MKITIKTKMSFLMLGLSSLSLHAMEGGPKKLERVAGSGRITTAQEIMEQGHDAEGMGAFSEAFDSFTGRGPTSTLSLVDPTLNLGLQVTIPGSDSKGFFPSFSLGNKSRPSSATSKTGTQRQGQAPKVSQGSGIVKGANKPRLSSLSVKEDQGLVGNGPRRTNMAVDGRQGSGRLQSVGVVNTQGVQPPSGLYQGGAVPPGSNNNSRGNLRGGARNVAQSVNGVFSPSKPHDPAVPYCSTTWGAPVQVSVEDWMAPGQSLGDVGNTQNQLHPHQLADWSDIVAQRMKDLTLTDAENQKDENHKKDNDTTAQWLSTELATLEVSGEGVFNKDLLSLWLLRNSDAQANKGALEAKALAALATMRDLFETTQVQSPKVPPQAQAGDMPAGSPSLTFPQDRRTFLGILFDLLAGKHFTLALKQLNQLSPESLLALNNYRSYASVFFDASQEFHGKNTEGELCYVLLASKLGSQEAGRRVKEISYVS